jgi:hypothetical protein
VIVSGNSTGEVTLAALEAADHDADGGSSTSTTSVMTSPAVTLD